ncbi:unnamed protein product [Prunus brigantina]
MAQNQSANVDLFDAYFRRADLDRDGRISDNEGVALFQASAGGGGFRENISCPIALAVKFTS